MGSRIVQFSEFPEAGQPCFKHWVVAGVGGVCASVINSKQLFWHLFRAGS